MGDTFIRSNIFEIKMIASNPSIKLYVRALNFLKFTGIREFVFIWEKI